MLKKSLTGLLGKIVTLYTHKFLPNIAKKPQGNLKNTSESFSSRATMTPTDIGVKLIIPLFLHWGLKIRVNNKIDYKIKW